MAEPKVIVPLCRYDELIDIETRSHVLISRLDAGQEITAKDIYLIFGYEKVYKTLKENEEKEYQKFLKEIEKTCRDTELQTKNTGKKKESVAQT